LKFEGGNLEEVSVSFEENFE